ncbi:YgiW/YdeI family stress tolerance OB fold protein [Pasteurellaceae bacterium 22721_9_1]
MKKCICFMLLLALSVISGCVTQPTLMFGDTSQRQLSITEVKKLHNGSYISLQGYIVEQLNHQEYQFKDLTEDKIKIEIADHVWNGLSVSYKDKINIRGKLDKSFGISEIDVLHIEKVQ